MRPTTFRSEPNRSSGDIKGLLNGHLLPVGLDFAAAQLGLGNLPDKVGTLLRKVKEAPLDQVRAASKKAVGAAGSALKLGAHKEYKGLLVKPVEFRLGAEDHRLWAVSTNGKAGLVAASTPGLIASFESLLLTRR